MLAASAPADLAPVQSSFLQYGVLGAVALLGVWFAWRAYLRETKRADDAEARLYTLQESVRTEFVPAMTRATDVIARLIDYLPELSAKRGRS